MTPVENQFGLVEPKDHFNDQLLEQVHPPDWVNPKPHGRYNLVVIGAGPAGLIVASGAAGLGARVALVERHLMGGDCLISGCVPSKAMIRSATARADIAAATNFGIRVPDGVDVDFARVMERIREVRAGISHMDGAKRFSEELNVDVFMGSATFSGSETLQVGDRTLRFRRAVITTGARAFHPPLKGLAEAGYLTNETVFSLTEQPGRLAVIGGGPIGSELAQSFQRLGSKVTLLHSGSHILNREDPDAAEIVQKILVREGMDLVLDVKITRIEKKGDEKILHFESRGKSDSIAVDEILVGAGRAPNVEGMGLENVDVKFDVKRGIEVDDTLRTTNPNIFAAGDCCMDWKFTHAADAAARIVIQNSLFKGQKKLSSLIMPWCTYTDPEIAHVGLYERDAEIQNIPIETFIQPLDDNDRARCDGETEGFAKVHVSKKAGLLGRGGGQIVGATIVARQAGDMINELTLAMHAKISLGTLGGIIHPYPTQAEIIKRLGDAYNRTKLTPPVQKWMERWLSWTR